MGALCFSRIGAFGWILLVWLKIGERKGKKKFRKKNPSYSL